jgi:heme exporter protein D
MRPAERYWFTRFWASVLVGLGVGVMVLGIAGAGLLLFLPEQVPLPYGRSPILAAAVALAVGLLVGAPLVLVGQLVQVFLDQRRLLARIHRRLSRWEDEREADRPHPMRGPVRPA